MTLKLQGFVLRSSILGLRISVLLKTVLKDWTVFNFARYYGFLIHCVLNITKKWNINISIYNRIRYAALH